jgi:hypothetical protein
MRFEIISNDLKCILFKKYGFLKIKSPIRMYQYEMPVPRGSAFLSMNRTRMYSEPVPTVPDTPVNSATLYLHRIRSSSSSSSSVISSSLGWGAGKHVAKRWLVFYAFVHRLAGLAYGLFS